MLEQGKSVRSPLLRRKAQQRQHGMNYDPHSICCRPVPLSTRRKSGSELSLGGAGER